MLTDFPFYSLLRFSRKTVKQHAYLVERSPTNTASLKSIYRYRVSGLLTGMSPLGAELDSRTASFERKRPRYDSFGLAISPSHVPTSRRKLLRTLGKQDVRDLVPAGGSFSSSMSSFTEGEDLELVSKTSLQEEHANTAVAADDDGSENNLNGTKREEKDAVSFLKSETLVSAQPMNWNNGTKSKIRITLGAERNTGGKGAVDGSRQVHEYGERSVDTEMTTGGSRFDGVLGQPSPGASSTTQNIKLELHLEEVSETPVQGSVLRPGQLHLGEVGCEMQHLIGLANLLRLQTSNSIRS